MRGLSRLRAGLSGQHCSAGLRASFVAATELPAMRLIHPSNLWQQYQSIACRLMHAVWAGSAPAAELLLERGANVNATGGTAQLVPWLSLSIRRLLCFLLSCYGQGQAN